MSSERQPPDDRELDGFLDGRHPLGKAYREATQADTAPRELDDAILRMAREAAAQAPPRRARRPRWIQPLAIAATLTLSLGVLLNLWRDPAMRGQVAPGQDTTLERMKAQALDEAAQRDRSTPPQAAIVAEPQAQPAPVEAQQKEEQAPLGRAGAAAPPPPPPPSAAAKRAPAMPAPSSPKAAMTPPPAVGRVEPDAAADDADEAARRSGSGQREAEAPADPRDEAPAPAGASPSFHRMLEPDPPAAASAPPAPRMAMPPRAPAPAAPTADGTAAESAEPAAESLSDPASSLSPEQRFEAIRALLRQGGEAEALRALQSLRRDYPDLPLPPDLQDFQRRADPS